MWYQIMIFEKHNVLFAWTCENLRKVVSHGGWDHNFESSKVGLVLTPTALEKGISYSLQSSNFLTSKSKHKLLLLVHKSGDYFI